MAKKEVAVKKETKEVAVAMTAEQMEMLKQNAPAREGGIELRLPRLARLSKDLTEENGTGRNKTIKVLEAAGTFYTEYESDELDAEGNKMWKKEFFKDPTLDVIIFYTRRQLRCFDDSSQSWISSPIYDEKDEIVPLFQGKKQIAKDTPEHLQAMYPALTAKGNPTSKLKETKILYVLIDGKPYQMNLSESSKYEFKPYQSKNIINMVVTTLGSIQESQGSNDYCKTSFTAKRPLNGTEANVVIEAVTSLKEYLAARNAQYGKKEESEEEAQASKDFSNFPTK